MSILSVFVFLTIFIFLCACVLSIWIFSTTILHFGPLLNNVKAIWIPALWSQYNDPGNKHGF